MLSLVSPLCSSVSFRKNMQSELCRTNAHNSEAIAVFEGLIKGTVLL